MKKIYSILSLMLLSMGIASAQNDNSTSEPDEFNQTQELTRKVKGEGYSNHKLEVWGFTGYQFGGKINTYSGEVNFKDRQNYGVGLAVLLDRGTTVEFTWSISPTSFEFKPYRGVDLDYRKEDVNVNYLMVSSFKEIDLDRIKPFIGGSLGTAYFSQQNTSINDTWRMAFGLTGGLKFFLTEKIGLRIQTRLLMPVYFNGVGISCGVGTGGAGCGTGVSTTVSMFQGDVSGGILIAL